MKRIIAEAVSGMPSTTAASVQTGSPAGGQCGHVH